MYDKLLKPPTIISNNPVCLIGSWLYIYFLQHVHVSDLICGDCTMSCFAEFLFLRHCPGDSPVLWRYIRATERTNCTERSVMHLCTLCLTTIEPQNVLRFSKRKWRKRTTAVLIQTIRICSVFVPCFVFFSLCLSLLFVTLIYVRHPLGKHTNMSARFGGKHELIFVNF